MFLALSSDVGLAPDSERKGGYGARAIQCQMRTKIPSLETYYHRVRADEGLGARFRKAGLL
jgi:hypothetical protein